MHETETNPYQPPNETALQRLHTGTYFGERIGSKHAGANSPATVGSPSSSSSHPQLLLLLLLQGAETNCDPRFHH